MSRRSAFIVILPPLPARRPVQDREPHPGLGLSSPELHEVGSGEVVGALSELGLVEAAELDAACDAHAAHDIDEAQQPVSDAERVAGREQRGKQLPTEEMQVAEDEAIGSRGVDGLGREHADHDRAEQAAYAVHRPDVHCVVPRHLLDEEDRGETDDARGQTNDHGRPDSDVPRAGSDDDEAGHSPGHGAKQTWTLVTPPGDGQPSAHGDRSGDVRVHEGLRRDAVGGQRRPSVEAEPAEPEERGAEGDERQIVRLFVFTRLEVAAANHEHRSQRRESAAHVNDHPAGEVEHAVGGEVAAAPGHVRQRQVDEEAPEDEKDQVARELHPVGEGAGDQRRSDDGEHLEVAEMGKCGDAGRPGPGRLADATQREPVEVADEAAPAAREHERVAHEHPNHRDDAHGDEGLHDDRKEVLAPHKAPVEEGYPGGHDGHQCRTDQDESGVACADHSAFPPFGSELLFAEVCPQGTPSATQPGCLGKTRISVARPPC